MDLFGSLRTAPAVAEPEPKEATLAERFEAFHAANPHVLAEMLRLARARLGRGETRIGVKALWEELRSTLEVQDGGDAYKLNNNYTALYARKLIEVCPELADAIEIRQRRAR